MWRLCLVASVQLIQRKSRIKKTRTRGYEKEQKGKLERKLKGKPEGKPEGNQALNQKENQNKKSGR